MTTQEAIKTIKLAMAQVEWEYPLDYAVAFTKAIEALEKVEAYKSITNDVINDVENKAYWLRPTESSYFNQGVAERMVLDCKKEIAKELEELYEEYYKKLYEVNYED